MALKELPPNRRGERRFKSTVYAGVSAGVQRQRTKTFTAGSVSEARRVDAEFEAEVRRDSGLDPTEMTFREVIERWIRDSTPGWRPSTPGRNRRRLEKHVPADWWGRPASEVTPGQVRAWYNDLLASGLSAATVTRLHAALKTAYRHVTDLELVDNNRLTVVRPPKQKRVHPETVTQEQAQQLLMVTKRVGGWQRPWFTVAAKTGMRRAEVCALQWQDVDFDDEVLTVRRSMSVNAVEAKGRWVVHSTKADETHQVWLDGATVAELRRWHRVRQADVTTRRSPWVFPAPGDPSVPMPPDTVSRWWQRHREELGFPGVRLHQLRHTQATMLLAAGVDPVTVAHRLGHQDPRLTLRVYGHARSREGRKAGALAGALLGDETGGVPPLRSSG